MGLLDTYGNDLTEGSCLHERMVRLFESSLLRGTRERGPLHLSMDYERVRVTEIYGSIIGVLFSRILYRARAIRAVSTTTGRVSFSSKGFLASVSKAINIMFPTQLSADSRMVNPGVIRSPTSPAI